MHQNTLTKTETAIIKFLLSKPLAGFSIKSMAKNTGQDYRIVYESVQKLAKKRIIGKTRQANASVCKINFKTSPQLLSYMEHLRSGEFSAKHTNAKAAMDDVIGKISAFSFTMILFGSYSKGTHKKDSDLDLLFLTECRELEKDISSAIASAERISPIGIHETILTYNDFAGMVKENGTNLAKEILESHIIFYGAEAFYKMMGGRV